MRADAATLSRAVTRYDGISAMIAAAAAGLADPLAIIDAQRRELLRRLRDAQRAAMAAPDRSDAALLLEGIALRLQADLRWLEACERNWTGWKDRP